MSAFTSQSPGIKIKDRTIYIVSLSLFRLLEWIKRVTVGAVLRNNQNEVRLTM